MTVDTQPMAALDQPARSAPDRRGRWRSVALGLALPVGLAVLWELAVRAGLSDGRLVPPPLRIFATFAELAATGELTRHTIATVLRVAAGFGLGVLFGTLLGAIAGYSTLARALVGPTLLALRAIPSIAWVPLFILWLGIFEASKVALIAVGVFFPVYLGVMGAILSVDRKIVEIGRIFRDPPTAGRVSLDGALIAAPHPKVLNLISESRLSLTLM